MEHAMDEPASQLSQSSFEGALDTAFEIRPGGSDAGPLAVRLVEVKARPAPPGHEQFSVLFVGPASPVWPQGTYRFVHAGLGEIDLFMVPVGRASAGVEYEVCISRDTRSGTHRA
jgi:hypothetical protein